MFRDSGGCGGVVVEVMVSPSLKRVLRGCSYDIFIFARGDVASARVIMESLEEFKATSGLVPSKLPVKYLGVPLISSRLLNKDCKVLQLGKIFASPCMREGLSLRSLKVSNKALMTKHIWNIVTNKESLWVRWIHAVKLRGCSFWAIPLNDADMIWGWRKLLQLRDLVRPYICTKIGNGNKASAWYDLWDIQCPLVQWLTTRDISREGFSLQCHVADFMSHNEHWHDSNGNLKEFSVRYAWEAFCPRGNEVSCFSSQIWLYVRHLADMEGFHNAVDMGWNMNVEGFAMYRVVNRLKGLKLLFAIDKNPTFPLLHEEHAYYLLAFKDASFDKERFFRQNPRDYSHVFHEGNAMADDVVTHYEYFLSLEGSTTPLDDQDLYSRVLDGQKAEFMVRDVTDNEKRVPLFSIWDDKAPCKLLKELNHTIISLIPKVTTPARINDYQPISCCNVLYKCISKIIDNRIKEGLDDLCLFARGHPNSVNLIMNALEEFKNVLGLVPSIHKSTTFFCNVPNALKAVILNSLPFAEGYTCVTRNQAKVDDARSAEAMGCLAFGAWSIRKKTSTIPQLVEIIVSIVLLKLVTFKFKKVSPRARLLLDKWKIPSLSIVQDGSSM
ncbi:hypothetical protein Tco_0156006 [Tanacetum coccineum]